jgi:small subunit ribosomal protein S16
LPVKIRLTRHGAKKAPYYRVVVADGRARRDGRFIEIIGRYDPRTNPSTIELDLEKADSWIAKGAQPTETAGKLIAAARGEKTPTEKEATPSKKSVEKAAAEAQAAEKAKEAEASASKPAAEADDAKAEQETADADSEGESTE